MPTFRSLLSALDPALLLPPPVSSLAQAARATLPASSSAMAWALAFIPRARRKTVSSLGGRTTSVDSAPVRWMCSRPPAVRLPLPAVWPGDGELGTLTGGGSGAAAESRIETRSLPTGNAGHTLPPAGVRRPTDPTAEHTRRLRTVTTGTAPAHLPGARRTG